MNYRRLNIILLLALLALGPLLLLVPWLRDHADPLYPRCVLEQLVKRPCPMCGLTTGLRDLVAGITRGGQANPLTIPVAALVLWEVIVRALLSVVRLSPSALQLVRKTDTRLHVALLACYLVYCVFFFATGT